MPRQHYRIHPRNRLCVAAALIVATCAAHATTVYKWVDENGLLHLEQRPRPLPPVDAPIANRGGARVTAAALVGRWRASAREKTVTLTLAADGSCVWLVELRGAPWSRQPGTWRLVDGGVELRTRLGQRALGIEPRGSGTLALRGGGLVFAGPR